MAELQMANGGTIHQAPPGLSLGNFQFGAVPNTGEHVPLAFSPEIARPTAPTPPIGPLQLLTGPNGRVFMGKGFNTIFRPRSAQPLGGVPVPGPTGGDNDLELNLTNETLTFTKPIGNIPNRGLFAQPDIVLGGITYIQSVSDVTNEATGSDDNPVPTGIHVEPGIWVSVPADPTTLPEGTTLTRMASIPHGTTINAQGVQPDVTKPQAGKPTFPVAEITPFSINGTAFPSPASNVIRFPSQTVANKQNRIPQNLDPFVAKGTITQAILDDPNQKLRDAIKSQDIVNFVQIDISTLPTPLPGGGTANIGFLGGQGATATTGGSNENAFAFNMTATFWLETVRWHLTVQGGNPQQQTLQPAGQFGPTFIIPPTTGHTGAINLTPHTTQVQYSQRVVLNFATLSWPHISVATLGDTSTFQVALPT